LVDIAEKEVEFIIQASITILAAFLAYLAKKTDTDEEKERFEILKGRPNKKISRKIYWTGIIIANLTYIKERHIEGSVETM
jgi:hypothetical protein